VHLVITKENYMKQGNKTKTEILISLSVLLFGIAVFFVIIEVISEALVY